MKKAVFKVYDFMCDLRTRSRGYRQISEDQGDDESDIASQHSGDRDSLDSLKMEMLAEANNADTDRPIAADNLQGDGDVGEVRDDDLNYGVEEEDNSQASMEVNIGSSRSSLVSLISEELQLTDIPAKDGDGRAQDSRGLVHTSGVGEAGQSGDTDLEETGTSRADNTAGSHFSLVGFHGPNTRDDSNYNQETATAVTVWALLATIEMLTDRIAPKD